MRARPAPPAALPAGFRTRPGTPSAAGSPAPGGGDEAMGGRENGGMPGDGEPWEVGAHWGQTSQLLGKALSTGRTGQWAAWVPHSPGAALTAGSCPATAPEGWAEPPKCPAARAGVGGRMVKGAQPHPFPTLPTLLHPTDQHFQVVATQIQLLQLDQERQRPGEEICVMSVPPGVPPRY